MAWLTSPTQVNVQVKGILQGEFCYVNLWYYQTDTDDTNISLTAFLDAFEGIVLPVWSQVQVDTFEWLQITASKRGVGAGQSQTRNVSVFGLVDDQSLPVYNTWSFSKIPDNSAIVPAQAEAFKPGRYCLSGVPESMQENGNATAAAQALLDSFDPVPTLLPEGTTRVWGLYMIANPGTPSVRSAPVIECSFNRMGTQLTRKN